VPVTFVAVATKGGLDNVTTVTINKPTGTIQGDFLLAAIGADGTGTNAPSGWTLYSETQAGTSSLHSFIYYKFAGASEPSSYSWTSDGDGCALHGAIIAYRGVRTTSPISGNVSTSGSTDPVTGPSVSGVTTPSKVVHIRTCRRISSTTSLTYSASGANERADIGSSEVNLAYSTGMYDMTNLATGTVLGLSIDASAAPTNSISRTLALAEEVITNTLDATAPAACVDLTGTSAAPSGIAVRSTSFGTNSGATTSVAALPTGTVSGDFLLAFTATDPDGPASALTAPAGWAQTGPDSNVTSAMHARTFWKVATGSEPATYTFGATAASDGVVCVVAFTGVDTNTPIAVASTYGASATAATAAVAPTTTGTDTYFLVCGFTSQNAGTFSTPTGMTEIADQNFGWTVVALDAQQLTASGATGTRTATHSVSNVWAAMSLVLKPGVQSATGSVAAIAPSAGSSLDVSGTVNVSGTIAKNWPGPPTVDFGGSIFHGGPLNATAPAVTADINGTRELDVIVAIAPAATADTEGAVTVVGTMSPDAPRAEMLLGIETKVVGERVIEVQPEDRTKYIEPQARTYLVPEEE
jgi:hypothetical protein